MSKKFSTFDLGLATALFTLGHKLLETDKTNPKKVKFIFEDEKDIEKAMDKYWNDEVKLPALTLFNNQKTLKNRIYSNT